MSGYYTSCAHRTYSRNGFKYGDSFRNDSVEGFLYCFVNRLDLLLIGLNAVEGAGQRNVERLIHALVQAV